MGPAGGHEEFVLEGYLQLKKSSFMSRWSRQYVYLAPNRLDIAPDVGVSHGFRLQPLGVCVVMVVSCIVDCLLGTLLVWVYIVQTHTDAFDVGCDDCDATKWAPQLNRCVYGAHEGWHAMAVSGGGEL
jgi:hypothetical protein